MLDLIEPFLRRDNLVFTRYDGSMRNDLRDASLERLRNNSKCRVLLCSLKCGSLGLNLTAASRVVILEPSWNPFVEEQAINRVYRLNQIVDVTVYKLTIANIVGARILELQEKKRALANAAIGGDKNAIGKLSMKGILNLFKRDAENDGKHEVDAGLGTKTRILTAAPSGNSGSVNNEREGQSARATPPVMEHRGVGRKEDSVFGRRCIAVCLVHGYTFHDHEAMIGHVAKEIGFEHVSLSHELMPMIKLVPRATSACADAYLTPAIKKYIAGFQAGFEGGLGTESVKQESGAKGARCEFMQSDGGLVDFGLFSGLRAILSGPAGGVVGYALTSYDSNTKTPVIGFDMGGTSTDVSRYGSGRYEYVFKTTTAGVTIQSPQLNINTVAAGGGSRLFFRNGLFVVGPESAGAHPGPAYYRKGGRLTVTDANLYLGRLLPDFFPKIFGKSEDQGLDMTANEKLFKDLTEDINKEIAASDKEKEMSPDEVAYGFIKIANETMTRPIRSLTEAKGHDTSQHRLATFGGAGG